MLRLTGHDIRVWADEQGTSDQLFAELDYRLVKTLEAFYSDDYLSQRIYLKGGTAINKLYLGETSRLSIDLDFNHVGKKEKVLGERRDLRERIINLLRKQDPSYVTHTKHRYELTTIKSRYKTIAGPTKNLKIEISHIERFPIIPPVRKKLSTPTGSVDVTTYSLEELTATKLRALLERSKGRDIYDLYFISKLRPNTQVTKKMFLYYFYRSRKVFNPKLHFVNLIKRYEEGNYIDDVSTFIKPTVVFDLGGAASDVSSYYSFLNELDAQDKDFLKLAAVLLGRKVAKKSAARIQSIEKPLQELFGPIKISQEALDISLDDIKLYDKKK